ncbi:MAG: hypothetical protein NTY38_23585 [Acidobacteria bacterium]|nr:hypothetical protein [Acidobacteriota bacterium]
MKTITSADKPLVVTAPLSAGEVELVWRMALIAVQNVWGEGQYGDWRPADGVALGELHAKMNDLRNFFSAAEPATASEFPAPRHAPSLNSLAQESAT